MGPARTSLVAREQRRLAEVTGQCTHQHLGMACFGRFRPNIWCTPRFAYAVCLPDLLRAVAKGLQSFAKCGPGLAGMVPPTHRIAVIWHAVNNAILTIDCLAHHRL